MRDDIQQINVKLSAQKSQWLNWLVILKVYVFNITSQFNHWLVILKTYTFNMLLIYGLITEI